MAELLRTNEHVLRINEHISWLGLYTLYDPGELCLYGVGIRSFLLEYSITRGLSCAFHDSVELRLLVSILSHLLLFVKVFVA